MRQDTPEMDLNDLRKEDDALDQSIALNRIVIKMIDSKKTDDFWIRILLAISILVNIVICSLFVWELNTPCEPELISETVTTTTVDQDTGEGTGNNVYQAGEHAVYTQEEVNTDGEAESGSN